MEFYGWLALMVLIAIAIRSLVKKYMKPDAGATQQEAPAAQENAAPPEKPPAPTESAPAAPAPAEPSENVPQSPLDMPIDKYFKYLVYLLLGGAALYACLWMYGCADAASDVDNGLNMLTYHMKLSNMNPISRQGYKYYIENNTDMPQRRQALQQKMDDLQQKMDKLNQTLNP